VNGLAAGGKSRVKAVLVCVDADLGRQFMDAASAAPLLHVDTVWNQYPPKGQFADRLRRIGPQAVLIDVSSNRDEALALIGEAVNSGPQISVIGVSRSNDPETILQCLRSGAGEFLCAPFQPSDFQQAFTRIAQRVSADSTVTPAARGRLLAFAPVKGGCGATTLACNTAYRLGKASGGKVLLADLNLTSGVVSFLLRINHPYTVVDAIRHSGQLDEALWASLVTCRNGIDILPSSERPEAGHLDPYPVQQVLEYARGVYEYVVVDLASVCDPVAMAALSSADRIHLVCSPDMSALFLMRRTIPLLEEMGFTREQIRVVVNRYLKRSELSVADMEKIFRWPVERTFAYEPDAVRQATREGIPVAENSDLGKSIGKLVDGIVGSGSTDSAKAGGVGVLKELLSGI